MADDIRVKFSADVSELIAGAKASETAVKQAGAAMQQAGQSAAPALASGVGMVARASSTVAASLNRSAVAANMTGAALTGMGGSSAAVAGAMSTVQAGGHAAAGGLNAAAHASSGVTRELIVMAHEMSQGNYSRFGGSMMVIAERMGGLSMSTLGVVGALAVLGFGLYKVIAAFVETRNAIKDVEGELALMGRASEVATGHAGASVRELADEFNLSGKAAGGIIKAIDAIPEATREARTNLQGLVPVMAKLTGEDQDKVADRLGKSFSTISGIEQFARSEHLLDAALEGTLSRAKESNDIFTAQEEVISRLNARLAQYSQKLLDYNATHGVTNVLTLGTEGANHPKPTTDDIADGTNIQDQRLADVLGNYRTMAEEVDKVGKLTRDQATLWGQYPAAVAAGTEAVKLLQTEIAGVQRETDKAVKESGGLGHSQQWQAELNDRKLAEDKFGKDALGIELQFWTSKKALAQGNVADEDEVKAQIVRIRTEMASQSEALGHKETADRKQQIEQWWRDYSEGMRQQIEAARDNAGEQARLVGEWVHTGEALYGEDVAKFKEALDEKDRVARAAADLQRELASSWAEGQSRLAQLSLQDQIDGLDEEVAAGRVKADEKYRIEKELYDKIYQLRRQDLMDEMAAQTAGSKAALEAYRKIEEEDLQHQIQLTNVDKQQAEARAQKEKQVNDEIARTAASSIMSMLQGKQTFGQVAIHLADQLLEHEIENLIKSGLQAIETETVKTGAKAAGEAAQTTIVVAGAATEKTVTATTASSSIMASASKAAAGAYAAMSGIPVIGPALGAAAAAVTFAAVMAFDGLFSAEGGWDRVPHDGALTELHKNEMVLSAPYADAIRGLADNRPNWAMPTLQAPGLPSSVNQPMSGGDFAPVINQRANFYGAPPGMSDRQFRGHVRRNTRDLVKDVSNLHRNAARR